MQRSLSNFGRRLLPDFHDSHPCRPLRLCQDGYASSTCVSYRRYPFQRKNESSGSKALFIPDSLRHLPQSQPRSSRRSKNRCTSQRHIHIKCLPRFLFFPNILPKPQNPQSPTHHTLEFSKYQNNRSIFSSTTMCKEDTVYFELCSHDTYKLTECNEYKSAHAKDPQYQCPNLERNK